MVPKRKRAGDSFFDFEFHGGLEVNDTKLVELKATKIENPRRFTIHEPYWSDALLGSFLDTFQYFAKQGIYWETLELLPQAGSFSSKTHDYIRPLLLAANTLSLFQTYRLAVSILPLQVDTSVRDCILAGITRNRRLKSLAIDCPFQALSQGDVGELETLVTTTSTLQELSLTGMHGSSLSLARSLGGNTTLEKLTLNIQGDDKALTNLVEALAHHPGLQELTILTTHPFGDLSSKAFRKLLLASTSLETLIVQDLSPYYTVEDTSSWKLNPDDILCGLRGNNKLRYLSLKNVLLGNNLVFSRFFQVLQQHSSIERFELLGTKISQEDLERVVHMDRFKRPIRLHLDLRILKDFTSTFQELLKAHPEIRRPWPHIVTAKSKLGLQLQQMWNMNWHGRHLLKMHPQHNHSIPIPMSMWPIILEAANSKPSILFEFLQGPAFAGMQHS
eukprot:scaffold8658_cov101-Cylindrotheca_fusiformis.AAC.3